MSFNNNQMYSMLLNFIGTLLVLMPAAQAWNYKHVGSVPVEKAAFSSLHRVGSTEKFDLSVSTFKSSVKYDVVYVFRDVGGQLLNGGSWNPGNNLQKEVLVDGLLWPNEVEPVPVNAFEGDEKDYWWVANGFLVPGKEQGSIGLIEAYEAGQDGRCPYHNLTDNGQGEKWWYHRVYFVDADGDNKLDMLTARADTSGRGVLAEMVYFKQPSSKPITSTPWDVTVLFDGPDALFRYEKMSVNSATRHAIFSCQYFAEKLVVSWSDSNPPDFKNMNHRVIEDIVDNRYFDAEIVDLNGDGKEDLLVSINSMSNGQLVAFEMPDNWATGTWKRHLIAEGFKPHGPIVTEGMGSPGTTFTFKPDASTFTNKPQIMLTGDDDSNIYVFESMDDSDPANWEYSKTAIFTTETGKGTVGAPSVGDVTGDGLVEVFVPEYSGDLLHVLKYER
ncbi:uncharacterized protein LOC129271434 [Lytechinus pictus]|uniref:uncharacterized protein LOC129271434 n=1 Tax=Lytechinus pictus TaxID=7653 RepID=UPI0030B9FA8E